MSFDLAIWKRSGATRTAMLAEAFCALSEDKSHPAMQRFDLGALDAALKREFGDDLENGSSVIACASGSNSDADWMLVQCSFQDADSVVSRVVPIALELGLLVYDPQREVVWGNKRPLKVPKKKK